MKHFTYQFVIPATIAAITTVVATSLTSYLLARPWCIEIDAEDNQRIVYGQPNCVYNPGSLQGRSPIHGILVNVDESNIYH